MKNTQGPKRNYYQILFDNSYNLGKYSVYDI